MVFIIRTKKGSDVIVLQRSCADSTDAIKQNQ